MKRTRGLWVLGILLLGLNFVPVWGSEAQAGTGYSTLASASTPPAVEGLWRAAGIFHKELPDGSIETDFNNGITRVNWPNGHVQLQGILYQGKPVTYDLEGNNELWHFDLKALADRLENNAAWQSPGLSGDFDFTGSAGIHYTQDLPGIQGNDHSGLTLKNGHKFDIFSEHQLTVPQLQNIAWVVALAPESTFTSENVSDTFFVADELGQVKVTGGAFVPLGGLHDTGSRTIFIRTRELDSYEATAFILRHESGHDVDARYGWLSRNVHGKDGRPLFGEGTLVLDKRGNVNLKESSFESTYAASNANEDFAETHEFLLRFRESYNAKNSGKDLFDLTPDQFHAELQESGISPELQEKMAVITYHVYAHPDAASFHLASHVSAVPRVSPAQSR